MRRLVDGVLDAVAPTLETTPGLDLDAYRATLLLRLANPELREPLVKVACNGAAKLKRAFSSTLRDLRELDETTVPDPVGLALAGYVQAHHDGFDELDLSFPLLDEHRDAIKKLALSVGDARQDDAKCGARVKELLAFVFDDDVRGPGFFLPTYFTCLWPTLASGPYVCILYTSPSPRDLSTSRMPSSA